MDLLLNLDLLSLVTKVSTELQNHVGVSDRTLAEFLIAQRVESKSSDEFRKKLDGIGADFPPSLVDSLDRLVVSLHPKFKKPDGGAANGEEEHHHTRTLEEKEKIFSGLSLPDRQVENDEADAIDDTLALLEGLDGKAGKSKATRKRSRSPEDDLKEPRRRRRDRSRSRERRKKDRYRSRSRSQDRGDEDWRDGFRDSRKDKRGRRRYDDDERHERHDRLDRPPEPEVDETPQMHKIYEGHVTGLKDFGAFVNLHHVRGKIDGLVHISRLAAGQRVNHPSDLLSKGQHVFVKVTSIEGHRIGLSMKDVDQETGMDLEPQARFTTGANMEALGGGARNGFAPEPAAMPRDTLGPPKRQKKRMTSPERWEIDRKSVV